MPDHACDRGAVRLDPGASRSQAYQPEADGTSTAAAVLEIMRHWRGAAVGCEN
jgi:hypothetical protein